MMHPILEHILSPFIRPAQKTVEQVQQIPKDNTIHVAHWSDTDRLGWFTTELYHAWWEPQAAAFVKEWTPWDFEDWIATAYYYIDRGPSFWEWWHDRPAKMQGIFVSEFIQAHEPMIRKEMDEYYENQLKRTAC